RGGRRRPRTSTTIFASWSSSRAGWPARARPEPDRIPDEYATKARLKKERPGRALRPVPQRCLQLRGPAHDQLVRHQVEAAVEVAPAPAVQMLPAAATLDFLLQLCSGARRVVIDAQQVVGGRLRLALDERPSVL